MAQGEYSLDVPIGNYTVKAIKSGYNVKTEENVVVVEGQTTEKNFQLEKGGSMGAHIFFANMECNSLGEFAVKGEANGTITTSNEQAKTGTYSLKSNVTLAGGSAYVYIVLLDEVHAELYFRFYYYLPTATYDTLNNADDYFRVCRFIDAGSAEKLKIRIRNDAGTVKLAYDYGPGEDSITCPTRDTWHCVEIYHKRDAAAGAWQWWVDGVSEGSGAGINTGANNCKNPYFSISASAGMTGAFYMDNIVISTGRIYELMGSIIQGNALKARVEIPQGWVI